MDSSTSRTGTTAASTRQYRARELSKRGIFFRKVTFAEKSIPEEVTRSIRASARVDPDTTFDELADLLAIQDTDGSKNIQSARDIVAEVASCLEDAGNEDIWTRNLWTKRVYPRLDEDRELMLSANSNWDAAIDTPHFRMAGLGRPKPDIAYGFRIQYSRKEPFPLLSSTILEAFEEDASINLHPRPSPNNLARLAYPGFVHEVKPASGTQQYVENQLAKSLVFAMDQQEELRRAAASVGASVHERRSNLPIIGMTSIGEKITIFCACEGEDDEVNIVEYDTLDLSQPRHAYAAILFVRAIAVWLKDTYRPYLVELLQKVHTGYRVKRRSLR